MINYELPENWILYNMQEIFDEMVEAKAAIVSLKAIPYQKNWADKLQAVQLKREVAGTSRIEGADFTDRELNAVISETQEQLFTRSQRQAAAAVKTYRWIAKLEDGIPVNSDLIHGIHRLIITDADDDHCPPGILRRRSENVSFGTPRHRGVEGGSECSKVFNSFCTAIQNEFSSHDLLIQALAAHYHIASMHPFLDGNGRTARAVEAFFLQKTGLKNTLFIAMSNYYYEEKNDYLKVLSQVKQEGCNLTSFIKFGLSGIALQCSRLFEEIKENVSKVLFRNMMLSLFSRLKTNRKRVIADRQIQILNVLLERNHTLDELTERNLHAYESLQNPYKAFIKDINDLISLRAIAVVKKREDYIFSIRLEWPTEITETKFFEMIKQLPKAKSSSFLSSKQMV